MLNGRKFVKNDFTSVSGRGSAVVDYCIVSHDSLPAFDNFNVIRTCDLVDRVIAERGLTPSSIPDHSVLTWVFEQSSGGKEPVNYTAPGAYRVKYDVSNVPAHFLCDDSVLSKLNLTMNRLEGSMHAQTDIDNANISLCII